MVGVELYTKEKKKKKKTEGTLYNFLITGPRAITCAAVELTPGPLRRSPTPKRLPPCEIVVCLLLVLVLTCDFSLVGGNVTE